MDFNILILLLGGKTTLDIANMLYTSRGSVRYRISHMAEQLELKNKEEIAEFLTGQAGYIHRKNENEKSVFVKEIKNDDTGVKEISGNPKWKVEIVPPGITVKVSILNGNTSNFSQFLKHSLTNPDQDNNVTSSRFLQFFSPEKSIC